MVNGTGAEAGADIDAPRLSFPYFDNRPPPHHGTPQPAGACDPRRCTTFPCVLRLITVVLRVATCGAARGGGGVGDNACCFARPTCSWGAVQAWSSGV